MSEPGSALSAWESFYVIIGSSGGALIGLQFVVITLVADRRDLASVGSLGAFGTPTVVHFGGALVVSALMSAPWATLTAPSATLAVLGLLGLVYGAIVVRRARRQTTYEPEWEDWLWFTILPSACYLVLTVAAMLLHTHPGGALFVIGGAALALLIVGIHNAWDSITHIVVSGPQGD